MRAAHELASVPWAASLIAATTHIMAKLQVGLSDKAAYSADPVSEGERGLLFEVRFAAALAQSGAEAEYEFHAGMGDTTVDFKVHGDPPVLLELVRLGASDAVRGATTITDHGWETILSTDAADPARSEEGELIKAQERIGEKAFRRSVGPIKFPAPEGQLNVILVEGRGYLGDGNGDTLDWQQVMLGGGGIWEKSWTNPRTGERTPIVGLFDEACPTEASATMRDRIHAVGFACEQRFDLSELRAGLTLVTNPRFDPEPIAARMSGMLGL